jgi:succinoglycan biosynthesis protein ExoM
VRFDPSLGVVGGEDMVFFRTANRRGLTIVFAADAVVLGHEAPERWTFRHQLRSRYWLGNTEFVTNRALHQAPRWRWALRGLKSLAAAGLRPVRRALRGRPPQFRYALASGARALGMLSGAAGIRVDHH